MSHAFRLLRIVFESRAELDQEYAANLVNGGLFLPAHLDLLYGEPVLVFIDLPFAGTSVELEGRVVQTIPVEFEANGGRSGVALELDASPDDVREKLESAIGDRFEIAVDESANPRVAPRSVAHLRARVSVPGVGDLEGRTRNLSVAGALVAISGLAPPVGQEVNVTLVHPTTHGERTLRGVVARHAADESGSVNAIGVQFSVDPAEAKATIHYLNRVKASEHARRLGGISGSIEMLGVGGLLTSFGRCVPRGRFTLLRSGEIGTVTVEAGLMLSARLGRAVGLKALVRMATWRDGSFEFHPNLIADEETDSMALPIEAALLEAARWIDESGGRGGFSHARRAGLLVEPGESAADELALSKSEERVLELAGTGVTVACVLDSIQEPDGQIERSLADLEERGLLKLVEPLKTR